MEPTASETIWAYLVHLGFNMWWDREVPGINRPWHAAAPRMRCDATLWDDLLPRLADAGANMLVIDLGEGVRYDSHPELAVEGTWEKNRLADSLARMRTLGLEPIPKLNFSTCHDAWLGPYSRMVSTPDYYRVCADLIAEVVDLFGVPRFFHLGMDEENYEIQRFYEYVVIRQYDLWWHDLLFYVQQLESKGVKAWVWSDYLWENREVFLQRMPKTVVQSNWYYGDEFRPDDRMVEAYSALDAAGYDQIPAGSNWDCEENFTATVRYCREVISPQRLRGFFQTAWKPTLEVCREDHLNAIRQLEIARSV